MSVDVKNPLKYNLYNTYVSTLLVVFICIEKFIFISSVLLFYLSETYLQNAGPSTSVNTVAVHHTPTSTARNVTRTTPSSSGTTVTKNVNVCMGSFVKVKGHD